MFGSNGRRPDVGTTESLHLIGSDGAGVSKPLPGSPESAFPESVSPDGKVLLYRLGMSSTDVGMLALEGEGGAEPLLDGPANQMTAEISPDGRWLVYQSDESGSDQIYVRPFPSIEERRWHISRNGGFAPKWSANGAEIFYRDLSSANMMAVAVTTSGRDLLAGLPEALFDASGYVPGEIGRNYDVSEDDRFLMIKLVSPDNPSRVVLIQNFSEQLKSLAPAD